MEKVQSVQRNGKIDFLKFVFSITIVLLHSGWFLGWENCLFRGGHMGVSFFFIVSGYYMVCSADKYCVDDGRSIADKTIRFIWSKVKKFIIPFVISCLLGFVVLHINTGSGIKTLVKDAMDMIYELTLMRMIGLNGWTSNPAAWYLSAMILGMFLLMPIVLKNKEAYTKLIAPFLTVFIMGILYQYAGRLNGYETWLGIGYLGMFRAIAELSCGGGYILPPDICRKEPYPEMPQEPFPAWRF